MAVQVRYDKHFEVKNKWQNQRIAKQKRNAQTYRWKSKGPRTRCNSLEMSAGDDDDNEWTFASNPIPAWKCSFCTYFNVERKSQCAVCSEPYSCSISLSSLLTSRSDCLNVHHVSRANREKKTNEITLAEFCQNVWHEIYIPIWTCDRCTYCNIEQQPRCVICNHAYDRKANNAAEYTHDFYAEISQEHFEQSFADDEQTCADDDDDDEDVSLHIASNSKSMIQVQRTNNKCNAAIDDTVNVDVCLKLIPCALYQKPKNERLARRNEDIQRYTLLEAKMQVLEKTFNFFPAVFKHEPGFDPVFVSIADSVIVPIRYKYRNKYGEFGGLANNDPLKCIAGFLWKAQYPHSHEPQLFDIDCIDWRIDYPPNSDVWCPAKKHTTMLQTLLPFIPLADIVTSIVFPMLGYDEIYTVHMQPAPGITNKLDKAYLKMQKYRQKYKRRFQQQHCGRLPFTLQNNGCTTIKTRKINPFDRDFKFTEVGFVPGSSLFSRNQWLNASPRRARATRVPCSKYIGLLYQKYPEFEPHRSERRRKRQELRYRKRNREYLDITQCQPKKYLFYRKYGTRYNKRTKKYRARQRKTAKIKQRVRRRIYQKN